MPEHEDPVLDALLIKTESGREYRDPAPESVSRILTGLGWPGNQWLVAERVPAREQYFFQVFRSSATHYEVEIREGGDPMHVATMAEGPEAVLGLLRSWHREDDGWRTAAGWVPFQEQDIHIVPGPELRAEATEAARRILVQGFCRSWRQAASVLVDNFYEGPEVGLRLVYEQAEEIVRPLWDERAAEQQKWPERTDCDILRDAFAALEDEGIVARADFACCNGCGHAEIGEFLTPDSAGYVFFHHQDTARAAEGAHLMLRYGAAAEAGGAVAVGTRIVERMRAAGLPVEWNGNPDTTISVGPLEWRNRLPGTPRAQPWPGG